MASTLLRMSSIPSSSEDHGFDSVELRSRGGVRNGAVGGWRNTEEPTPSQYGSIAAAAAAGFPNRVFVEHKVRPGDTVNKLALQYHVQVAEVKRANNLVADQDLFALPAVRIPVSRLQKDILDAHLAIDDQVAPHRTTVLAHHHAAAAAAHGGPTPNTGDRTPLLYDEDGDSVDEAKEAIEELLVKADATVAQVRGNLPSPGLEGGAFHFVDATSPDNTSKGVWILVVGVIFMFVVVPLLLTLLEEKSEAEAALHHHERLSHVHGSHDYHVSS
ncbi:LysM domain-containing protein [Aphelenchoides avenae]|nr:LysM domain-containing protein [Aphelenchus avenae]